jgi:hypothetical protein
MNAILGLLLTLQGGSTTLVAAALPQPTAVQAVLAPEPPVLDGRDTDAIWRLTPALTAFQVARPAEGAEPRLPTEARVAYDPHFLYVFVRAFDPHPDSIVSLLSRRDVQTASDQIIVMVDSYHDRRTGYEFVVNPAGVKADYAIYNDGNEDVAWDGVWDAVTRVDSLGWAAEYRIPLSQMRYSTADGGTFGFLIWRNIERYTEQVTWPLYRTSRAGFVSQFGELTGLTGLVNPRRAELTPYLVTKHLSRPTDRGFDRSQDVNLGGDFKYGIASNLTLNATINPDFGQVEADPAVLNLSSIETFYQEKRPFFVEGKGLFTFNVNCSQVNCSGEGLFYSRRIGRSPQLTDTYGEASSPVPATILGAGKVTGRLPGGLAVGFLDALTQRLTGPGHATIEPTTNYGALRITQDYDSGNGSVGLMVTAVNRSLDHWSDSLLRRNAYSGGVDFRQRLLGNHYEVSASLDLSRVTGSREAIVATQRDAVHRYQRPDGALTVDSTRSSLSGDAEEIHFGKIGGRRTNFETSYMRRSPGFEINDIGFLRQADQQSWNNWFGLRFNQPNRFFQRLNWNFNWWQFWTTAGLPTERAANTNVHAELNSRWWLHAGATLGQLGSTFCDRCARGGLAVRQDRYLAPWAGIEGDGRNSLVPFLWINYWRGDQGRSSSLNLNPELDLKVSSRFTTSLTFDYTRNTSDTQWYDSFDDSLGTTHFTFAHLEQKTLGVTWRLDYTFTRTASLQIYAQPFISKGTYTRVRELDTPRAIAYADRYRPYGDTAVTNNPGGFNVQQFNSNVVFRWEYRPGSTLFLVWSQGRENEAEVEGRNSFMGDFRNLFRIRPNDTFLIKASYWLDW